MVFVVLENLSQLLIYRKAQSPDVLFGVSKFVEYVEGLYREVVDCSEIRLWQLIHSLHVHVNGLEKGLDQGVLVKVFDVVQKLNHSFERFGEGRILVVRLLLEALSAHPVKDLGHVVVVQELGRLLVQVLDINQPRRIHTLFVVDIVHVQNELQKRHFFRALLLKGNLH